MPIFDPKIEVHDLTTTIKKALDKLTLLFLQLESNFDLPTHMAGIYQAIINGEINAKTIEQEEGNRIFQSKILAPYKSYFRHACIYTELARISQAEGDDNTAWSFISQANHQIGLTFGILSTYPGVDTADVQSKQGRKAAQTRHSKQDPERKQVVRLLSCPPPGGWKNEKEALESIIRPLNHIIQQSLKTLGGERFKLTEPKDLESSVWRWLRYDKKKAQKGEPQGIVRQAYEAYSYERLTNPNNH